LTVFKDRSPIPPLRENWGSPSVWVTALPCRAGGLLAILIGTTLRVMAENDYTERLRCMAEMPRKEHFGYVSARLGGSLGPEQNWRFAFICSI
jgi:hypothetical protein